MSEWTGGCRRISLIRVAALLVLLLMSGSVQAEKLSKYRGWSDSPEAAFMTEQEKHDWTKVRTDEEAERFVSAYVARRGRGFDEELKRRIQMADRYLSVGKIPGSRTLRGRMLILFGPPTRIERTGGTTVGNPESPSISGVYTNAGPMGAGRREAARVVPVSWTLTYSGEQVQQRLGVRDLVFVVEVDPSSGREALRDADQTRQFDEISRKLARWSVAEDPSAVVSIADLH